MVELLRMERASAPNQPVNRVTLRKQQIGQVGAILLGAARSCPTTPSWRCISPRRLRLPIQRKEWVRDFPLTSLQEPFILLSKIDPNRR